MGRDKSSEEKELIVVCSVCHSIRDNGSWVSTTDTEYNNYVNSKERYMVSLGYCDGCIEETRKEFGLNNSR